jgi:hypothetical protein
MTAQPTAQPIAQQVHAGFVQRLLAKEDPEATRHAEMMRRQEHDQLRQALRQAHAVRDAANQHNMSLIYGRRPDTKSLIAESENKLAVAETEVVKCAEALAGFEAAEKMRQHGPLGELVILLTVAVADLKTETERLKTDNERLCAALAAAGIRIP